MNMPRRRQIGKANWLLLASAWFATWHLFANEDVWRHPATTVPGPLGDNIVMLWNLGWVQYALSHRSPGFWFPTAYYPQGFLFLFSTHTWLDGVLGFLASPLLPYGPEGRVLWANLVQLFATTTTGLFSVLALREFGVRRRPIQLLGATAVTFCWFRSYAATGHYHFYGTEWTLAALAVTARGRRLLRIGFVRRGLALCAAAGVLIGLAFLNDQTLAIFATLLFVAIIGTLRVIRGGPALRPVLIGMSIAASTALVLAGIHLVPIAHAILTGKLHYEVPMLQGPRLVDASSILLPPDRHMLSGKSLVEFRSAHHLVTEEGEYLGTSAWLFILVAIATAIRHSTCATIRTRCLRTQIFVPLLLGLVFLVLALGEYLHVGNLILFVLPARILRYIPVLNNIRLLQRWIWPAELCFALSGSLALSYWFGAHLSREKNWLLIAWTIFAAAEGKWYPPAEPVNIHSDFMDPQGLVRSIRNLPRNGGVLMMPAEETYAHSNHLQFLGGYDIPVTLAYTARPPIDIAQLPWHKNVWTPETAAWLRQHKVATIVFHDCDGTTTDSPQLRSYSDWIQHAREAVPALVVLNRNGKSVLQENITK